MFRCLFLSLFLIPTVSCNMVPADRDRLAGEITKVLAPALSGISYALEESGQIEERTATTLGEVAAVLPGLGKAAAETVSTITGDVPWYQNILTWLTVAGTTAASLYAKSQYKRGVRHAEVAASSGSKLTT